MYVATENDTVYALAATNGAVAWSVHLGTPVPSSILPCGDISPTVGITSTPVIDQARGEIFVVADEMINGAPVHQLVGLSLSSGAVMLNQNVDPRRGLHPGPPPASGPHPRCRKGHLRVRGQLRRLLGLQRVGDRGTRGRWPDAHLRGRPGLPRPAGCGLDGWGGSGDRRQRATSGSPWATATSRRPPAAYDDSDSVLELSPSLQLEQFFAPSDWYSDNARDRDLGSSSPVLLANGEILQAGKSRPPTCCPRRTWAVSAANKPR